MKPGRLRIMIYVYWIILKPPVRNDICLPTFVWRELRRKLFERSSTPGLGFFDGGADGSAGAGGAGSAAIFTYGRDGASYQ